MPNWARLVEEVHGLGSTYDQVRRRYLRALHELTDRNVIVYYSGWLQSQDLSRVEFAVNDLDKNGLMATIHELDRSKGLDLFLHTPGGDIAATESIVDYLQSMFDDIRAVIPQLALSAGTMIALGSNRILMGKHSSLGPIDPQVGGRPAHAYIEEFGRIAKEIKADKELIPLWQPILAKYPPTHLGECDKAIKWANEMVTGWLENRMLAGEENASDLAKEIMEELGDHSLTKAHNRHISLKRAVELNLKVEALEADGNDSLQEAVLSVHHACILTLAQTQVFKLIENHNGVTHTELDTSV